MKKKNLLLTLALTTLIGCTNAYTNVSAPKENILSIGDTVITKGQVYNALFVSDGMSSSIELVMNHIMDIEIPMSDEIKAEAQKEVDYYRDLLTDDDAWSTFLAYNGYTTEAELLENLIPSVRQEKLISKYVTSKFDILSVTHKPIKAQIMQITDEKEAQSALERIKAGEDFEKVALELSSTSFAGTPSVYTTSSSLDSVVVSALAGSVITKIFDTVITGSDKKFYVLNIIDADPTKYMDEAIESITAIDAIQNDSMRYFLKQYDFKIHDKMMHEFIKQTYPDFIFE